MKTVTAVILGIFIAVGVSAEPKIGISGSVEWDTMRISAAVSLDLASAGIKIPAGRTQGEALLSTGYLRLIRPGILELQVDSSSTVGDLVQRGEFSLMEAESLALRAKSVPPALSQDMRNISASYTLPISSVSSALLNQSRPSPIMRVLNPVSTAQYTGIVIIADEALPIHGMRSSAMPVPCLFPKIWDSEMNLVYERNMLEKRDITMVHYSIKENIFRNSPSGLSPELQAVAGDRPLRIFARGVYGIKPTDLIIDRSDALLIISSPENRRLLSEGKVVIILDASVLKYEFNED
jgi:hypothetical protein